MWEHRGAQSAPAAGAATSSGADESQSVDHGQPPEPLAGGAAGRGEEGSKGSVPLGEAGEAASPGQMRGLPDSAGCSST